MKELKAEIYIKDEDRMMYRVFRDREELDDFIEGHKGNAICLNKDYTIK